MTEDVVGFVKMDYVEHRLLEEEVVGYVERVSEDVVDCVVFAYVEHYLPGKDREVRYLLVDVVADDVAG